jgi:hypothetical protein
MGAGARLTLVYRRERALAHITGPYLLGRSVIRLRGVGGPMGAGARLTLVDRWE